MHPSEFCWQNTLASNLAEFNPKMAKELGHSSDLAAQLASALKHVNELEQDVQRTYREKIQAIDDNKQAMDQLKQDHTEEKKELISE